jgi:tRNA-2-methylthio-N6-dimethylallyladenosine synthase
MNVYDSDRMADILALQGFGLVESPDGADMVILNTCHIREKAAEKVYSELGRLALLKCAREQSGGQMILAVGGCVAQAEGEEILSRAPYVDIVFGPQTYHRLPEMVARAGRARKKGPVGCKILDTNFPVEPKFDHLPEVRKGGKGIDGRANGCTAFLTVQEGCDKFCTFCVVPYTRGSEYSRPAEDVLTEASELAALGVSEITLLGQNVNNYSGCASGSKKSEIKWGLGRLITEVATIEGIERIRYTTSYPADVNEELIEAHRDVSALMPYLHLPVQSGSDSILKAMNRRHGADDYIRLVERLRKVRPDLGLSSDFIVGFPGETDADFAATLKIVKEISFAQAYSFKYSARPGTPAAMLENQVSESLKAERLGSLQEILNAQQLTFNRSCVGRTLKVLLDRPGRVSGQLVGRSPYMQAVHVDGAGLEIGTIVDLKITAGHANSLAGVIGKGALT